MSSAIALPAAQVEVADAEIGPLRDAHRLPEGGHQLAVFSKVVENLWHSRFRVVVRISYLLDPPG
jgi:hypothetical protein